MWSTCFACNQFVRLTVGILHHAVGFVANDNVTRVLGEMGLNRLHAPDEKYALILNSCFISDVWLTPTPMRSS